VVTPTTEAPIHEVARRTAEHGSAISRHGSGTPAREAAIARCVGRCIGTAARPRPGRRTPEAPSSRLRYAARRPAAPRATVEL